MLAVPKIGAVTAPADAKPGSSLSQRIAQRKNERQIKLDQNNILRIQGQCTFTQSKVRTLSESYTETIDNRDKVYRSIDAKLWIIIGSLKLIGKDTFSLEQQRLVYAKNINKFDNLASQFKQTIDDVTAMNCKADPNGFMALIETARLYNDQIRQSFQEIKSYVIDEIKPTITQHANDLKIKTTTE